MSLLLVAMFVAGGALLIGGAELLVRGASRIAVAAGISPLVVGLTVVAFGTSSPELAVTVGASWGGNADVALGNVVGSNIFNILFILGVSAIVAPLVVSAQLVRLDVPLVIGASFLVLVMALDGEIGRLDGLFLFAGVLAYTGFLVRASRRESAAAREESGSEAPGPRGGRAWASDLGLIAAGLVGLGVGARWLVSASVETATLLGVSEMVIGLTIVAVGTSLPEVATSVLASLRGERDIAVGNVVGSNLFNLLAVLGLGSLVSPSGVPVPRGALTFDLPIMVAVAVAALPVFFSGYRIGRKKGAFFLAYYVAYTAYLVLDAVNHPYLDEFADAMLYFALPITAVTLGVMVWEGIQHKRAAAAE